MCGLKIQALNETNLRLQKRLFCRFDKSDESLLNDYEALLAIVNEDRKTLLISSMTYQGFLIDEPVLRGRISDNWDAMLSRTGW